MEEKHTAEATKHKKPKTVGYGPLAAVSVTLGAYFASEIIVGLVFGFLPVILGWSTAEMNQWLDRSVFAQFLSVALISTAMVGLVIAFLNSRKVKWTDIGVRWLRPGDISSALVGYAVYFVAFIMIVQFVAQIFPGLNLDQEQEVLFSKQTTGSALWFVFVSLVILPPVVEEFIFRGFLYGGLRTKWPKLAAAVAASIIFAVAHLQIGSGNALLWVAALDTFVLSMILVYLRERTGGLVAPVLVHFIKNSLAFLFLFVLHL